MANGCISQVQLPNNETYNIRDKELIPRLRTTVGHSSKNLLDMTKYTTQAGISNIQINEDTGSLSFTGTGSWRSVSYLVNDNLGLKPNGTTYILTCINNLANSSSGRLAIRRRDTNGIIYSAYLSTTGKKELKFTASSEEFPNGWYISIMATGSTSTTSSIDISNLMLRDGSIADDTFEPYQEPTDSLIETKARAYLTSTVGHSSKNLLKITARATTRYNVTFTPDRINGTILATGQCNPPTINQAQYDYAGGLKPIPDSFRQGLILKDDGVIAGTQSGIGFYDDSGTYISGVACDKTTKSKTVTIPSNATKYKMFVRKLASAGNVDVTFKPMLRDGSISDDTFEPYQEPTDSLIEIKTRAYLNSTVGHACKNLLNLKNLSSVTRNGVTWTVDPVAGTITANGTATAQSQYGDVRFTLSGGNYYFSGCPSGGDPSTYDLYAWDYTTNSRPKEWDGSTNVPSDFDGTKKQFQVVNNHEYGLTCRVKPGVTVNNLIFKPMIWDGDILDDTFEPYVTPTDEAKQDKPVILYDAGESSVGVHSVTGLSNLTQYSELHITLYSPLNGDDPDEGNTHTIVFPFIFPYNPEHHISLFDCWIMTFIDRVFEFKRVGIYVSATNTEVRISGEIDEQTGGPISIPSNHYIYIKRIVGIP